MEGCFTSEKWIIILHGVFFTSKRIFWTSFFFEKQEQTKKCGMDLEKEKKEKSNKVCRATPNI